VKGTKKRAPEGSASEPLVIARCEGAIQQALYVSSATRLRLDLSNTTYSSIDSFVVVSYVLNY
jgi:hypothetical protein